MLSQKKFTFLVVSVITVFFIASWVTIKSPSAGTSSQPSTGETLHQTLPNEVDNIEVVSDASIFAANPELMSTGRYPAPTLEENGVVESERLLEYLRWKHSVDPIVENEMIESERLLEYLRWKHNTGSISGTGVEISEPALPQPSMGETLRQASLNWADYAETIKSERTSLKPWMGEQIRQASLNWADYVEVAQPEPVSPNPIVTASTAE